MNLTHNHPPRAKRLTLSIRLKLCSALALLGSGLSAHAQSTQSYYLLGADSSLAQVLDAQANTPTTAVQIVGMAADEQMVAIDVRPNTGRLYGLAHNPKLGAMQLYVLEMGRAGASATAVGPSGQFVDAAGAAVPILAIGFDMDFNPTVDRIRIVASNGMNFRMNPNSGAFVDGDLGGAANSVPGLNQDARLNGAATQGMGTAYTNNELNVLPTTQYTLDHTTNALYIQTPPNAGTLINSLPITLSGGSLDFSADGGIDIEPGINVQTSGTAATGSAVAVLTSGGMAKLYRVNLASGAATLLGTLGGLNAIDVAVANSKPAALALNSLGTRLSRFALDTPSNIVNANVSGVTPGERLVGMDLRPATGQVFALGIDAENDRGTLYRLEPQTGAGAMATAVGAAGAIRFVDAQNIPIDLSDSSYGLDVNPSVDRIRVVDATGLNFRVNPVNGMPVDGDMVSAGINPDGVINGALGIQLGATAYTNSSSGTAITTQYTLDQLGGKLNVQNPPNSGTQSLPLDVSLNGQAFEFGGGVGFDIPAGVFAPASNLPVMSGEGFFTSSPTAGQARLYRLRLSDASVTDVGAIATGGQDLESLVVTQTIPSLDLAPMQGFVAEAASPAQIQIRRSGGGPLTVAFSTANGTATAPADFTATSGNVFFGANDSTATISIPVLADGVDEPEESFILNLQTPSGALVPLTIRIVSDRIFANGFE